MSSAAQTARILKYEIALTDAATKLPVPAAAFFLHAAEQPNEHATPPGACGRLMVWYEVPTHPGAAYAPGGALDPAEAAAAKQTMTTRALTVIPTGREFTPAQVGQFRATVLMAGGRLVWHLYEKVVG